MSVSELARDEFTSDPRQTEIEELDRSKVEALQWLERQLVWEQMMTNLRIRAASDRQG